MDGARSEFAANQLSTEVGWCGWIWKGMCRHRFYSKVTCLDRDGFGSLHDMTDIQYKILSQQGAVHLIVGPHCSSGRAAWCTIANRAPRSTAHIMCSHSHAGMIPIAQLAVKYNVPIIGYESIASELLENRATSYATLSRVSQYGLQMGGCVYWC